MTYTEEEKIANMEFVQSEPWYPLFQYWFLLLLWWHDVPTGKMVNTKVAGFKRACGERT